MLYKKHLDIKSEILLSFDIMFKKLHMLLKIKIVFLLFVLRELSYYCLSTFFYLFCHSPLNVLTFVCNSPLNILTYLLLTLILQSFIYTQYDGSEKILVISHIINIKRKKLFKII